VRRLASPRRGTQAPLGHAAGPEATRRRGEGNPNCIAHDLALGAADPRWAVGLPSASAQDPDAVLRKLGDGQTIVDFREAIMRLRVRLLLLSSSGRGAAGAPAARGSLCKRNGSRLKACAGGLFVVFAENHPCHHMRLSRADVGVHGKSKTPELSDVTPRQPSPRELKRNTQFRRSAN